MYSFIGFLIVNFEACDCFKDYSVNHFISCGITHQAKDIPNEIMGYKHERRECPTSSHCCHQFWSNMVVSVSGTVQI